MAEHSAAKRAQKRLEEQNAQGVPLEAQPNLTTMAVRNPKDAGYNIDDFDARAKANAAKVSQIHEFRRSNIQEYEAPDVDLFKYDENESELKYSALKAENIFKYQNTFKAIRWGVTVGGLFAMHRYYRSRDLSSSVNWFCTMSSANFFVIWVSYGLQDFVTQRGTSKSIQDAARNEYHTNAYKQYISRAQREIQSIDREHSPIMRNSQSESMDIFITDYEGNLKAHFDVENQKFDDVYKFERGNTFYDQYKTQKISQKQYKMLKQHSKVSDIKSMKNDDFIERMTEAIQDRIDNVDLKGYNYSQDPDCSYSFRTQHKAL